MKKLFSLFILFQVLFFASKAQDTVRIKHTNYVTVFSKSYRYPVLVEWWETKKKIGCRNPLPRKNNFQPDPLLSKETDLAKDYEGSGFNRGHMMPAKSNQCQSTQIQEECFYFSNVSPQHPSLNSGDWKDLEIKTREWAIQNDSVHVWAGNLGELKKIGKVSVPRMCWKVVHITKKNEWLFFLFDNTSNRYRSLKSNEVDKQTIQELTGFVFK